MFISRSGASLNAIYGMDPQGKPENVTKSSPQGVALSEAQKQAISNSKFFEAGASMSLLNQPGKVGDVFDQHALGLATLLRHGLSEQSPAGGAPSISRGGSSICAMYCRHLLSPCRRSPIRLVGR